MNSTDKMKKMFNCAFYFNDILDENYQTFIGKSLYTSVKSLTYTYLNLFKVLSLASKENLLEPLPENFDELEDINELKKPFVKVMAAVTNLNDTVEKLSVGLFDNFSNTGEKKFAI